MKIKKIFLAAFTASMVLTAGILGAVNASATSEYKAEDDTHYSVIGYIPVDVKLIGDLDTKGTHGDSKIVLKAVDEAPMPDRTEIVLTGQDEYTFGPIIYSKPATYYYEVEREVLSPGEYWTYDRELFKVKAFIEVSEDDNQMKLTMAAYGRDIENKKDVQWVDSLSLPSPSPTVTPAPPLTSAPTPTPTITPVLTQTITPTPTDKSYSGGGYSGGYSGGGSSGGSYSDGKGSIVSTGDTSNMPFIFISVGAIALLAAGAFILKGKKKKA